MTTLYVNLEAISPIAIRADHATSRSGSSEYIPGNTLLGALAMFHRVFRKEQETEFEQLFLHGKTLYSNLYPATFDTQDDTLQKNRPVYPLPKTAQSCKRHSGFLPLEGDDDEGHGHGVRDTLVDWAMFRLGENRPSMERIAALEKHKNCKHEKCGEPMHHFEGYYRYSTASIDRMVKAKNSSRLQTHTGIDRKTGTVRENILYSRQVFEEGSKFWGEIRLPDDKALVESFTKFVGEVNANYFLHMGTGRTRGMGKVDISVQQADTQKDSYANFEKRIKKLDKYIHDTINNAWKEQPYEDHFFFALTLHSPAILMDEFLRYLTRIDENVLCELINIDNNMYELQECYTNTSTKRITSWQELWGTPRTNEYAIDTGSVFLFHCHKDHRDKLIDKLFNLEEQGIGKRRAEGFGRICISDPFHTKGKQEQ